MYVSRYVRIYILISANRNIAKKKSEGHVLQISTSTSLIEYPHICTYVLCTYMQKYI